MAFSEYLNFKEDIIDDPGKRDEKNIVQDPLNEPMDVNHQGNENYLDIEGKKKHSWKFGISFRFSWKLSRSAHTYESPIFEIIFLSTYLFFSIVKDLNWYKNTPKSAIITPYI